MNIHRMLETVSDLQYDQPGGVSYGACWDIQIGTYERLRWVVTDLRQPIEEELQKSR